MNEAPIRSRTSGRLCLLGEHADYLGLEVISLPLDRHLTIEGWPIPGQAWVLELEDLGQTRTLDLGAPLPPAPREDYVLAGFQRLLRQGKRFPQAYRLRIHSTIPIGKGVSSSSAFCVAWMDFLHKAAQPARALAPGELAEETYQMEVIDFQQAGGMQDQYTIAYGRLIHLDCQAPFRVTPLPARVTGLIVGDSGSTKDTQGVLSRIRGTVEGALAKLGRPKADLRTMSPRDVELERSLLTAEQADILRATLLNRGQAREGKALLEGSLDTREARLRLGQLLAEHHELLRSALRTSTPTIDHALGIARAAGALGGKVVGSGGGGCFIVYAPDAAEQVVSALMAEGISARAVEPGID